MLELFMSQFMSMMKSQGLDPMEVRAKIIEVVDDVREMKISQLRTEAMVARLIEKEFPPPRLVVTSTISTDAELRASTMFLQPVQDKFNEQ
jgi:hypothetical protein